MTQREFARLARELIERCGGLAEAAKASGVSKTLLSMYQNPNDHSSMSARVMADLEEYCGAPVFSGALASRFDAPHATGDLHGLVCDVTEGAADLQGKMRKALADGALTGREHDELDSEIRALEQAVDTLKSTKSALESAGPKLRAI